MLLLLIVWSCHPTPFCSYLVPVCCVTHCLSFDHSLAHSTHSLTHAHSLTTFSFIVQSICSLIFIHYPLISFFSSFIVIVSILRLYPKSVSRERTGCSTQVAGWLVGCWVATYSRTSFLVVVLVSRLLLVLVIIARVNGSL